MLHKEGYKLLRQNKQQEAIEKFNRAIELDPENDKAYCNRGIAYREIGEFDKGIKDIETAIKINPDVPEYYSNLGFAYLNKQEYQKVISQCNKAIELDENCYLAYFNRASAETNIGKNDKALEDVKKGLSISPNDPFGIMVRGIANLNKGKTELALKDFNKLQEMGYHKLPLYYYLGKSYDKSGDKKKAIKYYNMFLHYVLIVPEKVKKEKIISEPRKEAEKRVKALKS